MDAETLDVLAVSQLYAAPGTPPLFFTSFLCMNSDPVLAQAVTLVTDSCEDCI